jgi:Ca-activated chloride channel family protein
MARIYAKLALLLPACLLPGFAAGPAGAAVAPAAAPASGGVSPTKVLAQLAGHKGNVGFPSSYGQGERPANDRSLAPYLMVVGAGNGTEQVPLKETSADVSIAGVIARVQVHQLFANEGQAPIEAVYVFPASTRASVHGVRMKIGARTIEARIDRRAAARESYETARREGRRASLLEQERANVFTMSVANIMPGDRIAVELDYSEMLVPEDATYELVYPTVVGPRYAGGADPAKDRWMANPHLPAGTPEPYKFDIRVRLDSGIPIKALSSPSHEIAVNYASPTRADVRLAAPGGGNRDFVLRYRLAGDKIESGLLLWEGQGGDGNGGGRKENFFALMMEPPARPQAAQIPPREYIFLLDVSGSMYGFPLDTAKALMRKLLTNLRPTDSFDVALFSGAARVLSPSGSLPARKEEIANAIAEIERQRGGGGTELMGGLEMAYAIPRRNQAVSRTVVVVTDGFVGVEAQAFRFIRERLGEANLFAFGIGSSVNRGLIEGMARAGQGEPFIVARPEKASEEADKLRAMIDAPVLANVKVGFSGFDAYEVAPQSVPDLMARRPLVVYGKYRGSANGKIEISGLSGGGRIRQTVDVRPANVRAENAALRWLWARRWVDTLEDERAMGAGPAAEDAITALGLDYKLLTAFTSFVAVDSQVVNAGGSGQTVRQPLPMPAGVSNLAVSQDASGSLSGLVGPTGAMRLNAPAKEEKKAARGYGYGGLGSGEGRRAPAPMALAEPSASPPPPPSRHASHLAEAEAVDEQAPADKRKDDAVASRRWTVTVTSSSGVGATAPIVEAVRAALASGRAGCAAPARGALKLRLTVDGHGKVLRVDLLGGDRAAETCLRRLLANLASSTLATGSAAGTIDLTIART